MRNITIAPRKAFGYFLIILSITIIVFVSEYRTSLKIIESTTERYLEEAIYTYTLKFLDTRSYEHKVPISKDDDYKKRIKFFREIGYKYNHEEDSILFFQNNLNWEYRTYFGKDTIVSRMVKKKKHIPLYSLKFQSVLMELTEIEVDSIVDIFDNICEEKGIRFFSPVYLSVKTDLNDTIQYKNYEDEAKITHHHPLAPIQTGYIDEVIYQSYLKINFRTIYHRMPKHYIHPLYLLTLCLLFNFIWCLVKDTFYKRKTDIGIVDNNPNRYHIGHVLFDFDKQILYYRQEHKLNYKTALLLLSLLQSEDHTLTKKQVEKLCTGASNITTHMHTLRTKLEKSTCRYTVTSFKRTGYYQLKLKDSPLKKIMVKLNKFKFKITIQRKKQE